MPGRNVDRRFAQRMRDLLAQRALSYRALAGRTFYAKSYLHDVAHGRKTPTVDLARCIDEALVAGGELIALAAAQVTTDQTTHQALKGLADHTRDWSTADDWQEAAQEYGHAYLLQAPADLLRDLLADLTLLQTMLPAARGTRRAGLHDAAARIAALAAMSCTDVGYPRQAWSTWRIARRLAGESKSLDCQVWVRGHEATLGLYSGRPLPVVVDLVQAGLTLAGGASLAGRLELLTAHAQALSRQGRSSEAVAALDPARRAFDDLPDAVAQPRNLVFGWPQYRLKHTESYVLSACGTTVAAHRAHDEAIAAYPPGRVLSPSQIELHRAARLVRDGHIGDGVRHAIDALHRVPPVRRGQLVFALADRVLAAVPIAEEARSEVQELREFAARGAP